MKTHADDFKLKLPVVRDRHGTFARKIGATMTPEAFVIDSHGRVRYHGRIDDQFAGAACETRTPRATSSRTRSRPSSRVTR